MQIIKLVGDYEIDNNLPNKTKLKQKLPPYFEAGETTLIILSDEDVLNIGKTFKYLSGISISKVFMSKKFKDTNQEKFVIDFFIHNFRDGNVVISYY